MLIIVEILGFKTSFEISNTELGFAKGESPSKELLEARAKDFIRQHIKTRVKL